MVDFAIYFIVSIDRKLNAIIHMNDKRFRYGRTL